jgi:hypothetical protein
MERFMQYWDDLDDLLGMIGLVSERIRNVLGLSAFLIVALSLQAGGILLALRHPPLASAAACMLAFILLYHFATSKNP